jgi:hypothetical protein
VSVQRKGQPEPTFGASWMESRVATDRVSRTVEILDVKVPRARFLDDAARETESTDVLRQRLAENSPLTLSPDQLLAMLAVVEKEKQADEKLLTKPPKLEFRAHPAVLIQFDGQPRFVAAGDSGLMRGFGGGRRR